MSSNATQSPAPGSKHWSDHLIQFFVFEHLPPHLQEVSRPFQQLALHIAEGPGNPESTVALRKLLESKDAAVRSRLVK